MKMKPIVRSAALLIGFCLPVFIAAAQEAPETGIARTPKNFVFFPKGDLFLPLLGDLKEPRFSAGVIFYKNPTQHFAAASVSFGERFHILRYSPFRENEGLQWSIDGGIVSLFNFQTPSVNLINADYFGGLPLSLRHKAWSFRLRPYHQSSHLGDEFLLTSRTPRVNFSYEAVELLSSYDWKTLRFYGGAEFLIRRNPALDRWILHGGGEWFHDKALFWKAYPFVAIDLKSYEEHDFFVNTSGKLGVQFRGGPARTNQGRSLFVSLQGYYGHSPHGQFYQEKVFFTGLDLTFDF